jgi:sterol desaturase/sphingolipid hydroxylase (fatty acid hydroxylase superfamily)
MSDTIWQSVHSYLFFRYPFTLLFMLATMLPFVVLEQIWPAGPRPPLRLYGLNILIAMVTYALAPMVGMLAAAAADGLRPSLPWHTIELTFSDIHLGIPAIDPVLRILAMIFVPMFVHEMWFYWSHRLEHTLPLLWRFHRLHHSDENMNASTAVRDHVLQQVYRSLFSMFTLGLIFDLDLREAQQAALLSGLFSGMLSAFYHSAIRVHLPWLDYLLVTPQVHRIHHSTDPAHYNKNFADSFPLFDLVFGTFQPTRKGEFPATGLPDWQPTNVWAAQSEPVFTATKLLFSKASAIDSK